MRITRTEMEKEKIRKNREKKRRCADSTSGNKGELEMSNVSARGLLEAYESRTEGPYVRMK